MTAVKDFLGIRVEKHYVGIYECRVVLRVRGSGVRSHTGYTTV